MPLHSYLKHISDFFFSEKEWIRDYSLAPAWYIAAGNPTKSVGLIDNKVVFEQDTPKMQLIVAGDSMSPRGIYAGDRLTCATITDPQKEEFDRGTFISIRVDDEYYRSKRKQSRFKYKLRCAICKIEAGCSYEEMLGAVKQKEQTAYLEEYRCELERKFMEAREYYGEKEPLMLSITYKEGTMHYSLHPVRLIIGKVEKVERYNNSGKFWEPVTPRRLL